MTKEQIEFLQARVEILKATSAHAKLVSEMIDKEVEQLNKLIAEGSQENETNA